MRTEPLPTVGVAEAIGFITVGLTVWRNAEADTAEPRVDEGEIANTCGSSVP
ncbi:MULTISPECIES: hypothetical protein [unclassified Streptomyces]|uniref:hypothetical protein n=1 Tax=unclassified Streptomyces TaxID=2593676 RepID=UPI002E2E26B0|nr:hypothetical protein [Streptomyces sp. NBC_01439]